jgi:hypothetical protein
MQGPILLGIRRGVKQEEVGGAFPGQVKTPQERLWSLNCESWLCFMVEEE